MKFFSGLIVGALLVLIPTSLALIVSLSRPELTVPVTPEPVLVPPATSAPVSQPTVIQQATPEQP